MLDAGMGKWGCDTVGSRNLLDIITALSTTKSGENSYCLIFDCGRQELESFWNPSQILGLHISAGTRKSK